nr:MAG: hypothetical protein [Bacteriophage sp.]
MEEKLNIANILKDKQEGISLYSPVFGGCVYRGNCDNCIEVVTNNCYYFNEKGHYITNGVKSENGECILFPSKEMRDWRKFAWKKGDVLVSNDGDNHIIFKGFSKDDYTTFEGKQLISVSKNRHIYCLDTQNTQNYHIEDNKEVIQTYIKNIEEKFGGKLNRETLEIEKRPEFKDGDVVFVRLKRFCFIEIFNYFKDDDLYDHASLSTTLQTIDICGKYPISKDEIVEIRLATDSEKKQLFGALAKEGKAWDAEKKQIVDFKPKWMTLKPFDRVVTRVDDDAIWTANIFSHIDQYGEYNTIGCVGGYPYCLPYNEETAKLIGTTDDWKV